MLLEATLNLNGGSRLGYPRVRATARAWGWALALFVGGLLRTRSSRATFPALVRFPPPTDRTRAHIVETKCAHDIALQKSTTHYFLHRGWTVCMRLNYCAVCCSTPARGEVHNGADPRADLLSDDHGQATKLLRSQARARRIGRRSSWPWPQSLLQAVDEEAHQRRHVAPGPHHV